jgi:hypothetical protein
MSDKKIESKDGTFDIPPDGSLGLLALGAVGLKAWRKKREEVKAQLATKQKKDETQGKENSSPENSNN